MRPMANIHDVLFKTLADPTRRAIFERLCREGEQTVGALTTRAGVSQPGVSKHLGVRKQAGLVLDRHQGRQTHYKRCLTHGRLMVSRMWSPGLSPLRARGLSCAWSSPASGPINSRHTRAPRVGGRSSLRPWSGSWRGRTEVCHSAAPRSRDGLCATTSGRVGPRVRIRFPPAASLQTLGPSRYRTSQRFSAMRPASHLRSIHRRQEMRGTRQHQITGGSQARPIHRFARPRESQVSMGSAGFHSALMPPSHGSAARGAG
jgi:DNA-binding transcriptional ArsR family regulator